MISDEVQAILDRHKADREEWKQLMLDMIVEVKLLRLALQEIPSFRFDRQGNLLVRETDDAPY